MGKKLWGGRFKKPTSPLLEQFSSSLHFDRRLYRADVQAAIAHARALVKGGYLSGRERDRIIQALRQIEREIESGKIKMSPGYEDIHSLVLDHLVRKAGEIGKKLHAGRSRNDLISLDMRLYLKEEVAGLIGLLAGLQQALLKKGGELPDAIIPGYTHLQRAQPVLLAHHLLAYVEMLERDKSRLRDARRRMDVLPAGAAALAGTSLRIDQKMLARILGFSEVSQNSLDAVSDRDFVVEILSAIALIGAHLSRLSEDLVLWSSAEFDFVQLDESYCTGSSFLPHKLNPDPAELVRGKTGRLYGNLIAVLVALKGLPLSYNRDLQEDKEPLFDSLDTVSASLRIVAALLRTLKIKRESLRRALQHDYSSASDLAEYLVKQGVTFQEAHRIVGNLVRWCLEEGRAFSQLTGSDLKKFSPRFGGAALRLLTPEENVKSKVTIGSTAPARVRANLKRWKRKLGSIGS